MSMTAAMVREAVAKIAAEVHDDETAHSMEDDLHSDVLCAIADGTCEDPAACAREALKTHDLKFARWCA